MRKLKKYLHTTPLIPEWYIVTHSDTDTESTASE